MPLASWSRTFTPQRQKQATADGHMLIRKENYVHSAVRGLGGTPGSATNKKGCWRHSVDGRLHVWQTDMTAENTKAEKYGSPGGPDVWC